MAAREGTTDSETARPLRVLVTGGHGKIGSRVIERLRGSGHLVMSTDLALPVYGAAALDHEPYVRADLTDFGQAVAVIAKTRPDVLVHTAGIPEPNHDAPHVIFMNNVQSTFNILEAAGTAGITRVIYLSSETVPGFVTSERGQMPDHLPVDESHPVRPEEAYAMSKYVGELLVDRLVRTSDATAISIRASFVVGQAEYDHLLVDLRQAPAVPFGNFWSYVDVDDLADLVFAAVVTHTTGHEVIYAAQPDNFMGRPLAELLHEAYGVGAPLLHELMRPDASGINSSKACELLGWRPTRSWMPGANS